jgi:Fe-S-cluster containining protein
VAGGAERLIKVVDIGAGDPSPCTTCGACCSYSRDWPRFTTESDADLERIPPEFVNDSLSGMRCDGARCSALAGRVGTQTSCTIYVDRPEVCRACVPGDDACQMARSKFELPLIAVAEHSDF